MTYGETSAYHGVQWADVFSSMQLFNVGHSLDEYRSPPKKICIVGAGLAGLAAAYELGKINHHVRLFESSDRIGGRVYTHYFTPDSYGELGAMRVPADHQLTLKYVDEEFKLKRRPFVNRNWEAYLHFGRKTFKWEQWERVLAHLSGRIGVPLGKEKMPWQILEEVAKSAYGPLPAAAQWAMFSSGLEALIDPEMRKLLAECESDSLWQYITAKGRSAEVLASIRESNEGAIHLTQEEWEVLGRLSLDLPFERAAFTQWLINQLALQNPEKYEIEGGMSKLVEKFAASIEGRDSESIKLRSPVKEIACIDENSERFVRVGWQDPSGGSVRYGKFDYVICAAPAPATARIHFPQMSQKKFEALTNLTYLPSAKALIHCSRRYWETQDGIFGGVSHTDLGTQQSWYPSDNALPDLSRRGGVVEAGFTESGGSDKIGGYWTARHQERSNDPGTFLAAYMYGPTAQHFASLSEEERREFVCQNVGQYHAWLLDGNVINEKVVKDFFAYSWDDHSSPGGGAYAFFSPGEFSRYQKLVEQSIPAQNPRIFFAGEHTAVAHAWMQAALQSGVAAARRVAQHAKGFKHAAHESFI
ncbi:flavin monoamine oxidase family protein [Streptomyces sp. NBC_01236]|uniref:flavin monoamine oxidase family protein n=1 Tax=Streptomyces sp. NBC_01236 TaxID=2903789 RepID=UPI002E101B72|nr:FAD-dependent oxidoreductase [Streptomyces sp. NBC_01236]